MEFNEAATKVRQPRTVASPMPYWYPALVKDTSIASGNVSTQFILPPKPNQPIEYTLCGKTKTSSLVLELHSAQDNIHKTSRLYICHDQADMSYGISDRNMFAIISLANFLRFLLRGPIRNWLVVPLCSNSIAPALSQFQKCLSELQEN